MDGMADITTVRVRIEGRVQGVWYRNWTVQEASTLGLKGWVRNRRDGSVEALFEGPEQTVNQMIEACHRGPVAARVDRVTESPWHDGDDESPGDEFRQRPTE